MFLPKSILQSPTVLTPLPPRNPANPSTSRNTAMKTTSQITRTARKRVLIVDDHPFFRNGLRTYLDTQPDLIVCGEASNPRDALLLLETENPNLIITDLSLPGKGGLEFIKDLHALHPEIPVLVVTMHEGSHYAERVLLAGARGYISKAEQGPALLDAIRQILHGKVSVPQDISEALLARIIKHPSTDRVSPSDRLSDRELHIFTLLGQARSSREIAEQLHISIKTVEAHRANIKEKLNLRNAQELLRAAVCWVESENHHLVMK